jgi:hypothetical protein
LIGPVFYNVDQNIATRLLQKKLEDGSPLVRKELVVTMQLQYVVNSFPNNFMSLIRAIAEGDETASASHKLHHVGEGRQYDQGQQ